MLYRLHITKVLELSYRVRLMRKTFEWVCAAMHHHFHMLRDPVFWAVLIMGIPPLAASGAVLVWLFG
jgi:hypothetical protein